MGTTPVADGLVSPEFLRQVKAIPVARLPDHFVVAVGDPQDRDTLHALRLALGQPVVAQVGVVSEIESAIERQYGDGLASMARMTGELEGDDARDTEDIQYLRDLASEAPIIRMVNLVIARALDSRASDIHIEPFETRLDVRYRVDGVLREAQAPPRPVRDGRRLAHQGDGEPRHRRTAPPPGRAYQAACRRP